MTDNEKAATFIGWGTDRICKNPQMICHKVHTIEKDIDGELIPVHVAPDMADPRNYMKALASVAAHYRVYLELPRSDWIVISIWKDKPLPPNILIAHEQGTDAGIIISKALAALYDAEHRP